MKKNQIPPVIPQASPEIEHPNFPVPLRLAIHKKGRHATLLEPFKFVDLDEYGEVLGEYLVPAGFQTDFNSVPRGLWNFFPPWEYPEAGVVHDFLYHAPEWESRASADYAHRRVLELLGAGWFKRWSAWLMLRLFGWFAWQKIPG